MADLPVEELTDAELKALAHPLRVRMLEALVADGPATASQLAERFDENTGATSYHLRQLARRGFIEEDTARSHGRQRWWKVLRRGWAIPGYEFRRDDTTRPHATVLLYELNRARLERLRTWFETFHQWDQSWAEATTETDARITLTNEELGQLTAELHRVLARYVELSDSRQDPPAGAARVDVQLYAFPTRLIDPPDDQRPDVL